MTTASAARPATTFEETPVFIPSDAGELFGILTSPTAAPRGIAVIIFSGGHWVTSFGTNRIYVRLARALAAEGVHTLRFDYSGVGESGGATREFRLASPFTDNADAAVAWLREQGHERFVFVGPCYGARVSMAAGVRNERVEGVALFPPVTRDYDHNERAESLPARELARRGLRAKTLRRLRDPAQRRRYAKVLRNRTKRLFARLRNRLRGSGGEPRQQFQWVAPFFIDELGRLVDRKVPLLLLMGDEDDFYVAFKRGTSGPLGPLLEKGSARITTKIVAGHTHGLTSTAVQDAVIDTVTAWLRTLPA